MEKNIKTKVRESEILFKENLQVWFNSKSAKVVVEGEDRTNDFIQHLMDFPGLELVSQDFQKRKRIKNNVPDYNRCIAMKCNGERCSRKQKTSETQFCGTHVKGSPHGTISDAEKQTKKTQINLWLQEVNGIHLYIDEYNNVYKTTDIRNSVNPPKITSKYGIRDDGTYYIVQ